MSFLKVKDLSVFFKRNTNDTQKAFAYKKDIQVVNTVSFEIEPSQIFGIVGESGCGKSITAYSLMGILPNNAYSEGEIIFNGQNLTTLSGEQRRKLRGNQISMVFQEPMTSLNPVFTIGYQIAEVLMTHKGFNKGKAMTKAVELLNAVKIPSPELRVKDYPHQLSGGMRQRVMIAMAIACTPAILIADEPTTALDVTIQSQILKLIDKIKKDMGMSILLITHDLGIVYENTDRVCVMYAGRFLETAKTIELFKNPRHPYTIGLLKSLPVNKNIPLSPIPGIVPRPDNLPEGCKFSNRCLFALEACKEQEPDLMPVSDEHYVRCIRAGEHLWKMA
ncbi:MAG: ABC transporter ATP-binding protein [Candidatus Magnetoovum sp. WYHC-5]|nr:ABC transporter ATP-binding protein [Candidatus Magnetoovum sp. WYHC-5]